jgi:ribonuclease HI
MKTIIYTDGASRGNPGPGGWGAVIITPEKVIELGGRDDLTTNNKMELQAAIDSLASLDAENPIVLYTDSQYVIKGITEWIDGWVRKSWKNSQKKPVMNRDLWEKLLEASNGKQIEWKFVRGHADTPGNVRCDEIATRLADKENMKLYNGPLAAYPFLEILKHQPR